jgi:hypothetical protein
MFGSQPQPNGPAAPPQPTAAEVARILGGGLVQVVVSALDPMTFSLFLNDRPVPQAEVESLLVLIAVPEGEGAPPTARATLSRYVQSVAGERSLQSTELFPCTVELVALGRRIVVTCQQVDSLEGLWINLGLRPDGSSAELTGARELRLMVSREVLVARLTWMEGGSESLLPTDSAAPPPPAAQ